MLKHKKTIFTVIALLSICFCTVVSIQQIEKIDTLKSQLTEVEDKIDNQEQYNENLKSILNDKDTDKQIEQEARKRGFKYPDEILFYDLSKYN